MANTPTKEQIEAAEEFKKVAESLALPDGGTEEVPTTDAIPSKFIQIVLEDDLPQISFNGMSTAEILGTLELAKTLVLEKKLKLQIKKQTYQKLLEYDLVT